MEKTEIMRCFIQQKVVKALVESRLPYNHPIGALLEREAQIVGEKASVQIVDADGNWIMLTDRIKELKADPRFRDSVPNPAKIAKGDESSLRDNFQEIAKGTALVE